MALWNPPQAASAPAAAGAGAGAGASCSSREFRPSSCLAVHQCWKGVRGLGPRPQAGLQARCPAQSGAAWPLRSASGFSADFAPLLCSSVFLGAGCGRLGRFRFAVEAKKQAQDGVSAPASKVQEDAAALEQVDPDLGISWIQEKGEDIAFYATTAVQAIPGPRVGQSGLPWLVAVPLAYAAITFVLATVKTIAKLSSPKEKRRRQVGKNAFLNESLSEFLPTRRLELTSENLTALAKKCDFSSSEVLRKYIRYALNERPFNTDAVADLIHLRAVASIGDEEIPEILNEVSRRIVKAKGPVIMDTRGFTAKGLERKIAVQALFKKLLYLSELEDFCPAAVRGSLQIKEIFGVTDEDADSIRFDTLSELSDVDSLEKMVSGETEGEKEIAESEDS